MLNDNDRNHLKALCEQLEKAQVEVAVMLHNTRLTIRNLEKLIDAAEERESVAKPRRDPALAYAADTIRGLAQDSTLPSGVE